MLSILSVYEKVCCPAVYIHDMKANSGDKSINERDNDGVMEAICSAGAALFSWSRFGDPVCRGKG